MTKFLIIFISFFASPILACDCSDIKFADKFMQSDFVAKARIIKVYPNKNDQEIYKVDILIIDLFKGEKLKSVYIEGRSDGKKGSSCNTVIPKNTELIIYASKNGNNQFSFGSCSGYLILNGEGKFRQDKEKMELEMLTLLRVKDINFTTKIQFGKKMGFSAELKKFKGIELSKSYAIYELTFGADLAVKSVSQISGFGHDIDNELVKIVEKSTWVSSHVKSSDGSKILVIFYFYPGEKKNASFISEYN